MRDDVRSYSMKMIALIAVAIFCVSSSVQATSQINQVTGQATGIVQSVPNQINNQINGVTQNVTGQINNQINNVTQGLTQGITGSLSNLTQGPTQLTAVTQDISGQINGLTSQLNGLTGQIGSLTQNITSPLNSLTGQLNGITGQVTNLTQGLTSQIGNLTQGLTSQIDNVTQGLTSQIGGLTNQLGGLTGQLNGITGQLSNVTQGLTSQLGGITNQINGITGQLGSLTQGLTSQLNGITGQLSDVTQGITSELSGATSQLNGLTSQLSGLTSQLNGLTSQLSGLTNQLNGLTSQLSGLTSQLGSVTQDLTGAIGQVNQAISDATQAIGQATQAITQATQALGQASQAVSQVVQQGTQAVSSISQISLGGGDHSKYDPCPNPVCNGYVTPGKDTRYYDAITGTASSGGSTPTNTNPPPTLGLQYAMNPISNLTTPPDNPTGAIDPGLQGAMPHGIMPNKNTPAMSLVKNFPWLYKDIDTSAQGANYRGTGNEVYSKNINSPSPNAVASSLDTAAVAPLKCMAVSANCPGSSGPDYTHYEVWSRLQRDSCNNQYALSMSMTPGFIFDQGYRNDQYPYNETVCQPLRLKTLPCIQNENGVGATVGGCKQDLGSGDGKLYDYRAWGYLENAWQGVLDSNYTPNGGASGGDYGNPPILTSPTATIKGPGITGETKFGQPFNTTYIGGPGAGDTSPYTGTNTTLDNTIPHAGTPSDTNPKLIRVNDLITHSYERIWDPTHPFSPRWDFAGTDRDYSNIARLIPGVDWHGYDISQSPCIVRCASVPVDILSFRYKEFDNCMRCRINVNTGCFWSQVDYLRTTFIMPDGEVCPSDSNAVNDTITNGCGGAPDPNALCPSSWPWDCHVQVGLNPTSMCKTSLNIIDLWPPCSTKFDHYHDNVPPMCNGALPFASPLKTDDCIADANDNNPDDGVKKCCDDLAHAVAPINTLKIRNIEENPQLQPIPEGYAFKQYFGNHMPYMRWWDTGTAAGGTSDHTGEQTNYNPYCDMGQYDVLVGVGIEGKSCKYGGGAGLSYECINVPATDALTSWEELKQYQATSMRDYGLNCLPQYEKMYKQLGNEDGALHAVGGYFVAAFPVLDSTGAVVGSESKTVQWPLSWRGYLSDPNTSTRFPCFGGTSGCGASSTGLDNVQVGDVIYLSHDDPATQPSGNTSNTPSGANGSVMPFIAVVQATSWAKGNTPGCGDYIDVVDVNNGKYPDACGNSNYMGMGIDQPRRIYKNSLPPNVLNSLYPAGTQTGAGACLTTTTQAGGGLNINNQGNCNDPKQAQCTFGETIWENSFHVYTPTKDVRSF